MITESHIAPSRWHEPATGRGHDLTTGPVDTHPAVGPLVANGPPDTNRAQLAWPALFLIVLVKSAINLAVAGRYGWHIDELYYRSAGQHPMFGYTDFPPLVPAVARLAEAIFGPSLVGLRAFAILAGAFTVVTTALIARELGGRTWAQAVAALAAAGTTLGTNAMFQTVSFDQLTWALVLLASVRVLRLGTRRTWIALGAAIALAALTKYTVAVLVIGLFIGLVGTRSGRARLRGADPWLAALVAVVPVLPNLWWQARHGWPSVDFFVGRNGAVRDDYPPGKFVVEFLLIAGPSALVLWISGLRALVRNDQIRAVGVGCLVAPPAYLLLGGKGYYAVPIVFAAFAAGAVAWQERISPFWRRGVPIVLIVTPLLFSPFILPVLSRPTMIHAGLAEIRDDYGAELGWPETVAAVSGAWHGLPDADRRRTVLLARDYGNAGALELWGPGYGLPPVFSAHLSHRYWPPSPSTMAATAVLAVGYSRSELAPHCVNIRQVGKKPDLPGMLYGPGSPLYWCDLPGSVADLWQQLIAR